MRKLISRTVVLNLALLATGTMSFAQNTGEAIYKAKCQMCHGVTGAADTPAGKAMKAKPFNDPEVAKMSDSALLNVTKNGSGKMPAYKDKLTDAQLQQVVAYIHELEKKK